jgi:transcriptional regulator with XRE-family HTH domain
MVHPLKAYRDANGLTQERLGKLIGVPRETVARWECGARKIGQRKLLQVVSEKTGISPRELRPDLAELMGDQ